MLCRPGAASIEQGVVQTASARPSSFALAPEGLLMIVIGWGAADGALARCATGVSGAGPSGLGLSSAGADAGCCAAAASAFGGSTGAGAASIFGSSFRGSADAVSLFLGSGCCKDASH